MKNDQRFLEKIFNKVTPIGLYIGKLKFVIELCNT